MSIGERLRLLRGRFDLSQADMSSKFGIPSGSWKKYEAGPSEPGAGALRGLAEGGVNINWLLTGEGEMLLTDQVKVTETVTHNAIDTSMFVRVLERLSESDFEGRWLKNPYFGYFAALIYNKAMLKSAEHRDETLEIAIKELNLILIDQDVENLERMIAAMREDHDYPLEHIESLQSKMSHKIDRLGSARGKFTGRMLYPGTQLEGEFLKGLALSDDNDQK